jgi:hypothetical protein
VSWIVYWEDPPDRAEIGMGPGKLETIIHLL